MDNSSHPFQSVVSLGKLQGTYGYNPFYRNNRFILSGVTLAGMSCCLCLTAYAFIDDAQHPSAKPSDISPLFTVGIVIFFMLLGLLIIFLAIKEWWDIRNIAVGVFDQGLAYQDAQREMRLIPWRSVQEVTERKQRRSRVLFTDYYVVTRDGNAYLLHRTLKDHHGLAALVRQNAGLSK